ncbi:MAG: helix-turn-helix transcriptional regulator, partial [Spirosoma sp.]|nr:helix-turn-helix transcriptional regulator [Spirosoma sp.]
MKTTIEEKIRLQRLQRGFSQENMADLLNLSTTAYGDIERGKTELTLSRLNQIATVLNISPVALLTDDALMVQVIQPDDETERDRETLRLTIEKQQLEIDKLRLEA